jgi:hypothetical protein
MGFAQPSSEGTRLAARVQDVCASVAFAFDISPGEANEVMVEYQTQVLNSSTTMDWFRTSAHDVVEWELRRRARR